MPFTILFVGSGDTGRSVLAAAALEQALRRAGRRPGELLVMSAGMDVVPGMPVAPHLETVAVRRGLDVGGHAAVALTRDMADRADLVLAMSRRQRAGVVLRFPHLRPRTFTLLDFAAVAGERPTGAEQALGIRLRSVTAAMRRRSAPVPADDTRWDVPDPFAQPLDAYEHVADVIDDAVVGIASGLAAPLAPSRTA